MVHYRVPLFEHMHGLCSARGIEFDVVYGQPSATDALRGDSGELTFGVKTQNSYRSLFGRELVWQQLPQCVYSADLVILAQESRILSNYPMLFQRMAGGRALAYWGHGRNFQSEHATGLSERWKKLTLHHTDWWFTYTRLSAQTVKEHGVPEANITVLNNSIDTHGFRNELAGVSAAMLKDLRHQHGIDSTAPVGLYCGSLNRDKRLDVLVAASDRIRAAHPDFHLLVIGSGPSAGYLADAFKSRPGRHYVGELRGIEKARYFRLAQLILNPGLVGLSIVDAFCAGVPLVTMAGSKHSPEIAYLENEVNGIITADDIEHYSERIIRLLNEDENRHVLAANACAASAQYSIENMAENFVNGITECLTRLGKRNAKSPPPISSAAR
jgi:L-malate glycosyltransferase